MKKWWTDSIIVPTWLTFCGTFLIARDPKVAALTEILCDSVLNGIMHKFQCQYMH